MLDYISIEIPDMNDSISQIIISGKLYYVRFAYNDTKDYWRFSAYDAQNAPIVYGMKIVPNIPINLFCCGTDLPSGAFIAVTNLDRIGRNDFLNGKAKFMYYPIPSVEQ